MTVTPELQPHTPASAEDEAAWMRMDRDSRHAAGTGAYFTDTIAREDYPGDPQMWDRLRAMDDRLRALQEAAAQPGPAEAPPLLPRGRIPVGYVRTLAELDQSAATAEAKAWLDGGQQGPSGMVCTGQVGTGKTSLACAVAVEFGYVEAFWPVRDLLSELRRADFAGDALDGQAYRNTLAARSLLVIDDVGVERGTDYERDFLRGLLEARCVRPVATVVTTNLGGPARDDYLGARLSSRLAEWAQVSVLGPDRRKGVS